MLQAINCLAYLDDHTNCTVIRYDNLIQPSDQLVALLNKKFELTCAITSIADVVAVDAQADTSVARSVCLDALSMNCGELSVRLWKNVAPPWKLSGTGARGLFGMGLRPTVAQEVSRPSAGQPKSASPYLFAGASRYGGLIRTLVQVCRARRLLGSRTSRPTPTP